MHVVQHAPSQKYVGFFCIQLAPSKMDRDSMVCFFSLHQARNPDDVSISRSICNDRLEVSRSVTFAWIGRSGRKSPFSILPGRRVSTLISTHGLYLTEQARRHRAGPGQIADGTIVVVAAVEAPIS
jgi:hypothetical protein